MLPNKDYVPGIKHDESLRNLEYPLDWQGIIDHIGLPCILKDAHGGGWRDVYVCHTLDELLHHYDRCGLLTMIVQEFIVWDEFVRCICIGREHVLPMKYDPKERKYHVGEFLEPEMKETHHQAGAEALPRARLRHELARVRHPGRRPVRHRLHESGAGLRHQLAHADRTSSGRCRRWPT